MKYQRWTEQATVHALYKRLVQSPKHQFPDEGDPLPASTRQGVYVIFNGRRKVVHVGRTPRGKYGVYQRLRDHMQGSSSFTTKYLKGKGARLRGRYEFQYLLVANARLRALLEAYATGMLCPAHIGVG